MLSYIECALYATAVEKLTRFCTLAQLQPYAGSGDAASILQWSRDSEHNPAVKSIFGSCFIFPILFFLEADRN